LAASGMMVMIMRTLLRFAGKLPRSYGPLHFPGPHSRSPARQLRPPPPLRLSSPLPSSSSTLLSALFLLALPSKVASSADPLSADDPEEPPVAEGHRLWELRILGGCLFASALSRAVARGATEAAGAFDDSKDTDDRTVAPVSVTAAVPPPSLTLPPAPVQLSSPAVPQTGIREEAAGRMSEPEDEGGEGEMERATYR